MNKRHLCENGCGRVTKPGNRFINGHNRSFLGKCHTKAARKKMSLAISANHPRYWLGKRRSKATKRKISLTKTANPTRYWLGKKRDDATNRKISKTKKGMCVGKLNPFFGKRHTAAAKAKISEAHKGMKHTAAAKAKMRESRSRQVLPFKDTKPELKVQDWLDSKGVFYIPHVVCKWMQTRHQWDLYLPEDKLLIEINGCYWHGCPVCFPDKKIGKFDSALSQYRMIAKRNGWDILVLWEHDIKSGFAFNLLGSLIDGYREAA